MCNEKLDTISIAHYKYFLVEFTCLGMESSSCDFIKLCQIEEGGTERVGVMRVLSAGSGTRVNHLSSRIAVRVKTITAHNLNYKTKVIKSNIKYICRIYL